MLRMINLLKPDKISLGILYDGWQDWPGARVPSERVNITPRRSSSSPSRALVSEIQRTAATQVI